MTGAIQSTVVAREVPLQHVRRVKKFLAEAVRRARSGANTDLGKGSRHERDLRLEALNHVRALHP